MTSTTQLAVTAMISLAAGAAGTYATVHVTATCAMPAAAQTDDGLKAFLAKPDAPLTGWPSYK